MWKRNFEILLARVYMHMLVYNRQTCLPDPLSRSPCCVLLALSWNTTNEYPSTVKLSRAINKDPLELRT